VSVSPISLVSGDTLVSSSISFATPHTVTEQFSPWDKNASPIRSYSILTVVAATQVNVAMQSRLGIAQ